MRSLEQSVLPRLSICSSIYSILTELPQQLLDSCKSGVSECLCPFLLLLSFLILYKHLVTFIWVFVWFYIPLSSFLFSPFVASLKCCLCSLLSHVVRSLNCYLLSKVSKRIKNIYLVALKVFATF